MRPKTKTEQKPDAQKGAGLLHFYDLRRIYLTAAKLGDITASLSTATKNLNELCNILRTDGEPDTLADIRAGVVRRWKLAEYKKAGLTTPDPVKNYRLNCRLNQARSVFANGARRLYASEGLTIPPALEELASAEPFRPTARQTFRPLDEDTDARIKSAARGILNTYPRQNGAFEISPLGAVMVEMARLCGLTAKEIHYFQRDWVIHTRRGYVIDIREDGNGFTTKHSSKNRQVPIAHDVWERWKKFLPKTGYPFGPWNEYTNPHSIYSKVSRWLRQYIPDRQKKLHELRKMACSEVLEHERDIYAASYFIGDRVDTTAKYYAAQIRSIKPLE